MFLRWNYRLILTFSNWSSVMRWLRMSITFIKILWIILNFAAFRTPSITWQLSSFRGKLLLLFRLMMALFKIFWIVTWWLLVFIYRFWNLFRFLLTNHRLLLDIRRRPCNWIWGMTQRLWGVRFRNINILTNTIFYFMTIALFLRWMIVTWHSRWSEFIWAWWRSKLDLLFICAFWRSTAIRSCTIKILTAFF